METNIEEKILVKGAVYYADLDPIVGSEQKGIRPVLIIQNNLGNKHGNTILVAPISSNIAKELPTHVLIKQFERIRKDSVILLEQIRAIDKRRIKGFIINLDDETMDKVNEAIKISFDLN